MRFVVTIVLFVIAAASLGLGIAQRTVWAAPDTVTLTAETDSAAPLTIIDGTVLASYEGRQSFEISGAETVSAAYGRTTDVMAWIGNAMHNRIDYDPETQQFTTSVVPGDELEVPPLAGGDLWLNDYTQEEMLNFTTTVPEDVTVIIASDGASPAPSQVSVSWPADNATPWAEWLVAGGLIALVLGFAALIWALLHLRKSRGPRRKQPKLPRPPRPGGYRTQRAITSGSTRSRRSLTRSFVAIGLSGALALTATPSFAQSGSLVAAPVSPASTEEPTEPQVELPPTALTEVQLQRIVRNIGATVDEADAELDPELAATRLDGPALQFRQTSYKIQKKDDELGALPRIPTAVELTLPQQTDVWPRTVFTVVKDRSDETVPPVALVLIQETARAQYKVHYAITLEPDTVLPEVAPPTIGAARYPDDNKIMSILPADLVSSYGDLLLKGDESEFASLFNLEEDTLLPQIGSAFKAESKKKLPKTAKITFANEAGSGQAVAMATNDSGALVALSINEVETVKPVESGAAVNPKGAVKALAGKKSSTKGIRSVYGNQLLFYVPPITEGEDAKAILLGYSTALVSAKEL